MAHGNVKNGWSEVNPCLRAPNVAIHVAFRQVRSQSQNPTGRRRHRQHRRRYVRRLDSISWASGKGQGSRFDNLTQTFGSSDWLEVGVTTLSAGSRFEQFSQTPPIENMEIPWFASLVHSPQDAEGGCRVGAAEMATPDPPC